MRCTESVNWIKNNFLIKYIMYSTIELEPSIAFLIINTFTDELWLEILIEIINYIKQLSNNYKLRNPLDLNVIKNAWGMLNITYLSSTISVLYA